MGLILLAAGGEQRATSLVPAGRRDGGVTANPFWR
jgi:hypothetical protein